MSARRKRLCLIGHAALTLFAVVSPLRAGISPIGSKAALGPNDKVLWAQFGASNPIRHSSAFYSNHGLTGTIVDGATGVPALGLNTTYNLVDNPVYNNQFGGPVSITFDTPVAGFGVLLIWAFDSSSAFKYHLDAFGAGNVNLGGWDFPSPQITQTPSYIGVLDTLPEITRVVISLAEGKENYVLIDTLDLKLLGPLPTFVASRRLHTGRGLFDVVLPIAGSVATEPRQNGSAPQLAVEFNAPIEAADGSVDCGEEIIVTNGVCNNAVIAGTVLTVLMSFNKDACVKIDIDGLRGAGGGLPSGGAKSFHVITQEGNVTGDTAVNILDLNAIKNQLGQPVGPANFKTDLNCNGAVNILDLQAAKNNLNHPVTCP